MLSKNKTNWFLRVRGYKVYGSRHTVAEIFDMFPDVPVDLRIAKMYQCWKYIDNHHTRAPYREKFGRLVFKTTFENLVKKAMKTTHCEYTGVELDWFGGLSVNKATIDRKNNDKPVLYLKDLCFVSHSANSIKRRRTFRKFKQILKKGE